MFLVLALLLMSSFSGEEKRRQPVLHSFILSECVQNCKDAELIRSRNFSGNRLSLDFGIITNCATNAAGISMMHDTLSIRLHPKPIIKVRKEGNRFDSSYTVSHALCDCYFNVTMTIDSLNFDPEVLVINRRLVSDSLIEK